MAELKIRIPPEAKNWLSLRAADNARSMNAELISILETMMVAEPAYATVWHCRTTQHEWFAFALGRSPRDLCETETKEEAVKAATEKLSSLGFSCPHIEFKRAWFNYEDGGE